MGRVGMSSFPPPCTGCPARKDAKRFVPPRGPLDAPLCVIGHGPSSQDAYQGTAWFPEAPEGKRMERWLRRCGHQPSRTLFTDIISCWIPKRSKAGKLYDRREPTKAEISWCWSAHLSPLLISWESQPSPSLVPTGCENRRLSTDGGQTKHILAAGTSVTRWFMGVEKGVDKWMGTTNRIELEDLG
ncbi:MAG: hypothetical protein GY737_00210 [Desulfobacteraceae bacterium]|nr:hypothetical protein [Desulfobacteraceae bacterium]